MFLVCIVVFVVFFVCVGGVVSGGRLKYLLETSVVNMSNKGVIRLYLCRFEPLRLARIKNSVRVYDFSVNIQFSEGTFCV